MMILSRILPSTCVVKSNLVRSVVAPASFHSSSCMRLNFSMSEEQLSFQNMARQFARDEIAPVASEHDRTGEFPWDLFRKAHSLGFVNAHVAPENGGLGLGVLEECIVMEEIAWGCSGIATALTANSLAEMPVILGGSEEIKQKYLARMCDEPLVAAYGVTEPGAGSDVAGIQTKAVKKGDDWVISGNKMWITGAGVANWFFVLARTDASASAGKAFTGFVIDADAPGVTVGRKEQNMGQRASDTRGITFDEVVVPDSNRVGDVGFGFKLAMGAFDRTRPPVAANATGLAQRALDEAAQYSLERKTMGKPIAQHQMVQQIISEMAIDVELARNATWRAAWAIDQGLKNTYLASVAKCHAGAAAMRCSSNAVQIFGGNGYNVEMGIEKLMRDAKIFQIYEGTEQVQKLIISNAVLSAKKNGDSL